MRITLALAAVLLCAALLPAPAAAQRARPPAATTPEEAGPDFLLQGEYAGWTSGPGRPGEPVGLQVVAIGDGKFDAVRYRGGLPGAGWDGLTRGRYAGASENGRLNLAGPRDRFVVDGNTAIVLDDSGRELGRLSRVERTSPTLGQAPPPGALILFDGRDTGLLEGAKITPDGLLEPGVLTKFPVGAFRLHLEFRTPFMPTARGQARGNSGVYIQRRYEVQILDSFGLEGAENECGGLYRQTRPDVNACLPPLAWQTYDLWFTPPRFAADGTKLAHALITVLHNGIPIHWNRPIVAKTGGGRPEGPEPLPINLQDHGNPVHFRNIWLVSAGAPSFQVSATYSCPPRRGLFRRR